MEVLTQNLRVAEKKFLGQVQLSCAMKLIYSRLQKDTRNLLHPQRVLKFSTQLLLMVKPYARNIGQIVCVCVHPLEQLKWFKYFGIFLIDSLRLKGEI